MREGFKAFGDEELIAGCVVDSLADILEGIGVGPADADGFFSETKGGPVLSAERVIGLNPDRLVRGEVFGQDGGGMEISKMEETEPREGFLTANLG